MPPRLEREIREWSEQGGQRACGMGEDWEWGQALATAMVREPWRQRSLQRLLRRRSLRKRKEPARGGE